MAEKLHAFAQEAQIKTLVLDHRSDLTGQFHKMMDQQAHDIAEITRGSRGDVNSFLA
jgi:hypothetical protein